MKITVVRDILEANERIAWENRRFFDEKGVFVLNLMGSPGSGKTSLILRTIRALVGKLKISVIEGDICGTVDAERIEKEGVEVLQINTGGACHLDGNMIRGAMESMNFERGQLLIVENVGNLVCPAEFNIGEDMKGMLLSVPEGEDKPLKYPLMFRESSAVILNKIDMIHLTDTTLDAINGNILKVNPEIRVFPLSAKTGEGVGEWSSFLFDRVRAKRA